MKYKREMDFIIAQITDLDRKLDRPINDLDDIRIIMETQKKIRDSEIDMDMKIDLVEEAFSLLSKYKIQLSKEEVDKVESLEYNWLQLLINNRIWRASQAIYTSTFNYTFMVPHSHKWVACQPIEYIFKC